MSMRCTLLRHAHYRPERHTGARSGSARMPGCSRSRPPDWGCATCARRSAGWCSPSRSRPRDPASPTCAATPTTRCRAGTSAPRRSPCRTCTRTRTGCGKPVRRVGDTWHEVSWDEALDLVADNLARAVNEHGRDALAIYLGNPNVHSLGSMTHGTAMVKSFRTRNKYSATSVDQLPAQLLAYLMYGHQLLLPVPDLDRTDHFLVFGANPMASNGSLMTVPDFPARLRELKRRGGRMVVVDPRRTETAKVAHEHHFVRPGTDAFVLLAMLQVLVRRGAHHSPGARRRSRRRAGGGRAVHPGARRGRVGHRRGRRTTDGAGARGGGAGGGLRTGRRLDPGVRARRDLGRAAAQPGDRQPRPARRRDVHPPGRRRGRARADRQGPPRRVAQPGPRPAGVRRRAARRGAGRGDPHARRRPGEGAADAVGQPGLLDPRRPAARRGDRGAGLRGGGRHLRQRDDPARRRDPAADRCAGARPLRPGLPHARRAQHRPVHARRCSRSRPGRCTTGRSTARSCCAPRGG